mmetsp:Transcript_50524/g.50895  ORF Transcript_50524/g.50895 Transcript_50524/m.50895 type:complete len:453 (-) Transcript_50524:652-2010(-)
MFSSSKMIEYRRNTTSALVISLPLIALGTWTVCSYLRLHFGRTIRKAISLLDPIKPTEEFIRSSIYGRPLIPLDEIEDFITEKKGSVVDGAERIVSWHNGGTTPSKQKTKLCLVYIHGWSSCRQEGVPLPQHLASQLSANLYCHRLPGHGRVSNDAGGPPEGEFLLQEASANQLFLSSVQALRIGLSLGDTVVILGMSTGGALATWLASLQCTQGSISGLVVVSPAFALAHPLYPVLKHTFATLRLLPFFSSLVRSCLLGVAIGKIKNAAVLNAWHQRYNTLTYPSEALLHLLDCIWEIETINFELVSMPALMIGNPQDHVVDFRVQAANGFLRFGEVPKVLYCVTRADHPHCVASRNASPSTIEEISNIASLFLRANLLFLPGLPQMVTRPLHERISPPDQHDDEHDLNNNELHVFYSGLGGYARSMPSLASLSMSDLRAGLADITRPLDL